MSNLEKIRKLYEKAYELAVQGQYNYALERIDTLINYAPLHTLSYCLKLMVLTDMKEFKKTIELLEELKDEFQNMFTTDSYNVNHKGVQSYFYSNYVLTLGRKGAFDEAIIMLKKTFSSGFLSEIDLNVLLGELLTLSGRYKLALKYLRKNILNGPGSIEH